jgi:hypothetical protein
LKLIVPIDEQLKIGDVSSKLLANVANQKRKELVKFNFSNKKINKISKIEFKI